MTGRRLFVDTSYYIASVVHTDMFHSRAVALSETLERCDMAVTTEPIMLEICAAFSAHGRARAAAFVRSCYTTRNLRVVPLREDLFLRGLDLFEHRSDKAWSLTDCISFIVMDDEGITEALTSDRHFIQAGFRALLLESAP
ncbi:MAG: type II toxin-antitoxin system VapC family toxin [Armatimonadetes bacterium]|nr:type II toxin-antitoxin system VapC family toxin [Armatimonadota bacterium]